MTSQLIIIDEYTRRIILFVFDSFPPEKLVYEEISDNIYDRIVRMIAVHNIIAAVYKSLYNPLEATSIYVSQ